MEQKLHQSQSKREAEREAERAKDVAGAPICVGAAPAAALALGDTHHQPGGVRRVTSRARVRPRTRAASAQSTEIGGSGDPAHPGRHDSLRATGAN